LPRSSSLTQSLLSKNKSDCRPGLGNLKALSDFARESILGPWQLEVRLCWPIFVSPRVVQRPETKWR
jgi:hypothetical protein